MVAFDETFWVALSITIFLLLLFRYGKSPILSFLDDHSKSISNKLEEAYSLLDEAEKALAFEKEQHKKYILQAEYNVNNIENEVSTLKKRVDDALRDKFTLKRNLTAKIISDRRKYFINNLQMESVELALEIVTKFMKLPSTQSCRDIILSDALNSFKKNTL